jgi:hypothetical protein
MCLAVDVPSLDHISYVGQRLSDDLTALVVPPVANGVAYSRRELRCLQQEYWISRTSGAVGALAFQKTHHARARGAATAPCLQTSYYGAGSIKGRKRVQDQRSTGAEATSLNARSFVSSGSKECGACLRVPRPCYELGRKPRRNADSTIALIPLRSPFPAFLRRF